MALYLTLKMKLLTRKTFLLSQRMKTNPMAVRNLTKPQRIKAEDSARRLLLQGKKVLARLSGSERLKEMAYRGLCRDGFEVQPRERCTMECRTPKLAMDT